MNHKSPENSNLTAGFDPEDLKKPAPKSPDATDESLQFTMTQTSRDPETGLLVTGTEGEN